MRSTRGARLARVALGLLAVAGLGATCTVPGARTAAEGHIYAVFSQGADDYAPVADVPIGRFRWEAAASDDLRLSPGLLTLTSELGGLLEAEVVHRHDERPIDPLTGWPVGWLTRRAIEPAGDSCAGGSMGPRPTRCGEQDPLAPLLPSPAPTSGWQLFQALASALGAGTVATPGPPGEERVYISPLRPLLNHNPAFDGPYVRPEPIGVGQAEPVGLEAFLTRQQAALLGCGEFYGTPCDVASIDLMRVEASALFQSWPRPGEPLDTRDATIPQPGTTGSPGGALHCTRFVGSRIVQLPGCRGPAEPPGDGSIRGRDPIPTNGGYRRFHPFTGQPWRSALAEVSWNALMGLVALSETEDGDEAPGADGFDPEQPFRSDGCSLARPSACGHVQAMFALTTLALGDDPEFRPPLRWIWQLGAQLEVTAAEGDLAPFLGWTLQAVGPERLRTSDLPGELGIRLWFEAPEGAAVPDSPWLRTLAVGRWQPEPDGDGDGVIDRLDD